MKIQAITHFDPKKITSEYVMEKAEKLWEILLDNANAKLVYLDRKYMRIEIPGHPSGKVKGEYRGIQIITSMNISSYECRIVYDDESLSIAYDDKLVFECGSYVPPFVHEKISVYSGPAIKKVIFNNPATIVYWNDLTKTVVKCQKGDKFDPEKGLVMAYFKKMHGNKHEYYDELTKWIRKGEKNAKKQPGKTSGKGK